MKEVVINNVWRTKFYGYCDNAGKPSMHWEIEFPESELHKLEPFVHADRKVKFENEDGSVEWDCPPITFVKNRRFIHQNSPCDIFSGIGFRKNKRGENVCYTTAFFPIDYRRYKEGDTIRITGDCGQHLFNSEFGNVELNNGIELGVECVLVRGEYNNADVVIPRGILANDQVYLDARCIELVQAVEDKPVVLDHINNGPDSQLYIIDDPTSRYSIARIWFDPSKVPGEFVKEFAEDIKAFCDKKTNKQKKEIETHTSIMENKTTNDEFESKFGDFERQFAEMRDANPDKIREFITTVILASAHDNSLVDAAFKWVENKNKNKKPNKEIEDYIKLLVKILLEDVKEGKLLMERQESNPGKNIVVDFLFTPQNSCTKKIKVTFDYDELVRKIHCSRSEVTTK